MDASLVDFRRVFDGSGQKIKSWDERSESNPEQRKDGEATMRMFLSDIRSFT